MSQNDAFSGTRAVSAQHRIDEAALARWLQQHMPEFVGPLQVEMFKGGQSNPTYKLITPSAQYVMRAKPGPVAKLLPSAHAIEREFRVMQALHGTAVPVARMHVLCEDESVIGRAFYVMEFVQGRVLWDQELPGMKPAERRELYLELNRVLAALHNVPYLERGLETYGRPAIRLQSAFQVGHIVQGCQHTVELQVELASLSGLHAWEFLIPEHATLYKFHDIKGASDHRFVFTQHMHARHRHRRAMQGLHDAKLALDRVGRGQQFGDGTGFGAHHILGRRRDELVGGVGLPTFEHFHLQRADKLRHVLLEPARQGRFINTMLRAHGSGSAEGVVLAHLTARLR